MADLTLVLAALAAAAARAEGHGPCPGFTVQAGRAECPCGITYQITPAASGAAS